MAIFGCKNLIGLVSIICAFSLEVAIAVDCKGIPRWLEVKEVVFQVVEPTDKYTVKVELPDVTKLECSASNLEYGTDYSFTLKTDEPVVLSYYKDGEEKASRSTEMVGTLSANSVVLASEREITPHYFQVTNKELDVEYRLFVTKEKGPSHVERKGNRQKLKILSSK